MEVEWRVYADESQSVSVAQGVFPAQWLTKSDEELIGDSGSVRLSTLYPQIVPEIEREASKLIASNAAEASFLVPVAAFGLVPTSESDSDLYCVLTTHKAPSREPKEDPDYASWFDMKLQRAAFHRQRGNDQFKRDAIASAVRAYDKALQWLECPSSHCHFSVSETERVNALAILCHANLATCHWKRQDMDACIDHATRALALDPYHIKARYRRSQAYLQTKQFDEAITDLDVVATHEPENSLFSTALTKAKLARQHHRTKQQQALASAFNA